MTEIHGPLLRKRLDDILKRQLPAITFVAGIYYLWLAAMHARLIHTTLNRPLIQLALVSALVSMGLWMALRTWPQQVQRAHPVLSAQFGLALFNHITLILLTGDLQQTTHIMLLLIVTGTLALSTRWLSILMLVAIGSWLVITPGTVHDAEWWHFGWALFASVVVAAIIHTLRRRLYERLEQVQERDEQQQREQKQKGQRLATGLAIGKQLFADEDLDTLLNRAVETLKRDYACGYVGIMLLDAERAELVARVGTGDAGRAAVMRGTRIRTGRGLMGWVAQHHRPVRVADAGQDSRFVSWDLMPDTRSELVLPLMADELLVGVLDMQSNHAGHFHEVEIATLEILCQQITHTILNRRLRQNEKRHAQLNEALYNIGRALARPMGQEQLLNLILHQLATIIPHDRGAVMLRQGDGMEMVAKRGFPASQMTSPEQVPIRPGDVFDEIRRTQRPLVIADALQRADWYHLKNILPARSWVGVPLIHNDAVIGMLSLAREVPNPYTEDEVAFATSFAIQATIALEKAYLHDQVERLIHESDANTA
ncbi:MAG: GAF domain-containing protein [Anaerolineae bacterium]|nr:GAF domain-containing protein [Anaerolineae bacterium]